MLTRCVLLGRRLLRDHVFKVQSIRLDDTNAANAGCSLVHYTATRLFDQDRSLLDEPNLSVRDQKIGSRRRQWGVNDRSISPTRSIFNVHPPTPPQNSSCCKPPASQSQAQDCYRIPILPTSSSPAQTAATQTHSTPWPDHSQTPARHSA
jgi:hypothetical protein